VPADPVKFPVLESELWLGVCAVLFEERKDLESPFHHVASSTGPKGNIGTFRKRKCILGRQEVALVYHISATGLLHVLHN
jgi:hypothetical protein